MKYRPLDPVSKQIRLLKLHSGTEMEDIECHLEHVSLEDNPEFTALSYVWGDLTDTRTIYLHEVPFPITQNLHAALRSIRSHTPDEMSILWVDALCINQQDLAERSYQVSLMQLIYSQAKHTIVWFGPGNDLSNGAVRLMIEMINTLTPKDNPWFNETRNKNTKEVLAATHPLTHLVDRLRAWEALGYLVNLPWWRRIWVAQEIKLSKNAILLWGENTLRWEECQEAMTMIAIWCSTTARDKAFQDVRDKFQLYRIMQDTAVLRLCDPRLNNGIRRELLFLMDSFWHNEATDPRDKVYALLGLATDNHSESIVPDYKSPVGLVYAESVKDTIIRERNLQVFSYCSGLFTPRDATIPSWAPDWRCTSHHLERPLEQRHLDLHLIDRHIRNTYVSAKPRKYVFRAAGDSPPAVGFCKEMKKLYIVGIRVDVITRMSDTRGYDYSGAEVRDGWSTLSGFRDYKNLYPPTGQSRHNACMETLSAGQFTPASELSELDYGIGFVTSGRRFFVSKVGFQGLALSVAQMKDVIVVPLGGACPLILREMEGHYTMVGEAYGTWSVTIDSSQIHADAAAVHGIMNGELMPILEDGKIELEEFEIW